MSSGFGTFDGLTEWGPFEWPLSFDQDTIYLYIRTDILNAGSSLGPTFSPCPSVSAGSVKVTPNSGLKDIKLLSSFADPASNENFPSPVIGGEFQYIPQQTFYIEQRDSDGFYVWISGEGGYSTPQAAWSDYVNGHFAFYSYFYDPRTRNASNDGRILSSFVQADGTDERGNYVHNVCSLAHVPVVSGSSVAVEREYLYQIPAGNNSNLFTISISGLDAYGIQVAGVEDAGGKLGQVVISVSVYSRIKGKITKLSQLANYGSDTSQKPTPDDSRTYGVDGANTPGQAVNPLSSFKVGIKLDKAVTQKDNFGKKYNPYKIVFTPSDANSRDRPPPNPAPPLR